MPVGVLSEAFLLMLLLINKDLIDASTYRDFHPLCLSINRLILISFKIPARKFLVVMLFNWTLDRAIPNCTYLRFRVVASELGLGGGHACYDK